MLLGLGRKCRAVSGALLCLVQILLLVRYKFVWGIFLPLQCVIGMARILWWRTPFFMGFPISHLFYWHMRKHNDNSRKLQGRKRAMLPSPGGSLNLMPDRAGYRGSTSWLHLGQLHSITPAEEWACGISWGVRCAWMQSNFSCPHCFLHCATGAVPEGTPHHTSCAPVCFWGVGSVTPTTYLDVKGWRKIHKNFHKFFG